MDKEKQFQVFQKLCIDILAESDNCEASQKAFKEAKTIPALVQAWRTFLSGVIHEVPLQVKDAFARLYDTYKAEINASDLYYNEDPQQNHRCMVLIGDAAAGKENAVLQINGNHHVYVIGNQKVTIGDSCHVTVSADDTRVTVTDHAVATIEKGSIEAWGRAQVSGHGDITCHDSTVVSIDGGVVHDHGHLQILAYNDSLVDSFTKRRVMLYDKATLQLRPREK